jgi:hypothetical protein
MKKLFLIVLLFAIGLGIWKYISIKSQPSSPINDQSSAIKETKDALEKTVNYVPDAIDRKKAMEKNINDSVAKENERLQNSLKEIK